MASTSSWFDRPCLGLHSSHAVGRRTIEIEEQVVPFLRGTVLDEEFGPLDLELETVPLIDGSELGLGERYREGAIRARGREGSKRISGSGFLEMTGYGA